jgi:hypothetical protein
MNERIRELSKEAWVWAEQQEYTDPAKEFSDILEQKFAELIVRECCQKLENDGMVEVAMELKEHFGVEE